MRISDWSSDVCSSDLLDVFDEGFFLAPAWAYDTSLVGAQRHQGAYRRARLPLGSAFQPLAEQDECDDDGGWLEIIVAGGPVAGLEQQLIERSEEHTSEIQSLLRSSYAVFCLKKTK